MTFNWTTFLFEVVNFVVLAFVLHRLLYAPLRAAIAQRQADNDKARAEAEKAHQQTAALRQQLESQSAEMERQREEVMRQARQQAEEQRQKLLAEAEQASQRRQDEARRAIQQEREEALQALRQEMVSQAVALSQRLLRQATDRSLHRQLVLKLAEALATLSDEERQRLRRQWHPEDGAILQTADEVDDALLGQLNEAVHAVLGRRAALAVATEPGLIGGARLRLGGAVWDATLAGQFEEVAPVERNGQCPH